MKVIVEKPSDSSQSIYFLKQNVGNACGSFAVIHSIANNLDKFELDRISICVLIFINGFILLFLEQKPLAQFLEKTKFMTPEQRVEHWKYPLDMTTVNDTSAEEEEYRVNLFKKREFL